MKVTEINGTKYNAIATTIYYLLVSCVNPETNRIEFNGKAMNAVDICAYANITSQQFSKAVKTLYETNAIANVRTGGKDFYYMNPKFACDPETPPCLLDWLADIFEQEDNLQDKNGLVYFKKTRRNMSVSISDVLPK